MAMPETSSRNNNSLAVKSDRLSTSNSMRSARSSDGGGNSKNVGEIFRKSVRKSTATGSSIPKRGKGDTSHISRPEAWALTSPLKDDESEELGGQRLTYQVQNEWTEVSVKEECLEAIMSSKAHASYDCLGRHNLNPSHVTRTAMTPKATKGNGLELEKISQALADADDLTHAPDHSDDEYMCTHDLTSWNASGALPGEQKPGPSESFKSISDNVRIGYALPTSLSAKGLEPSIERVFATRCGIYTLTGVVNGHGNARISERLVELVATELPKAFFRSGALVKKSQVAKALSCAFTRIHCFACKVLDLKLTGVSVTVICMDNEHAWIAHVGDCRAVMGVPDEKGNARDFQYRPEALTEDHKLCSKKEFDRVHAAGGEIRKLMHDQTCRLFIHESHFPGLALTRAIGDRLAHTVGVNHKPSISQLKLKDLSEKGAFIVIGSSGIWSNMGEKAAIDWVGRTMLDPTAAVTSMAYEAMSRWQAPGCKSRGTLLDSTPESFSSVLLCFGPARPVDPKTARQEHVYEISKLKSPLQRSWVLGAPHVCTPRGKWGEVKTADRVLELKRAVALANPPEHSPLLYV
eukprot:TRINITY_DN97878_c0_g1_i1.p1 TRINITY_DN97878_c0_g1~~TRINITY_DN97878_c0_g1_i1.p1  ORF type:complete len:578 (+),score=93.05 TRINITY_DN97878_c0_g1_i1:87-1820(+)